MAGYAVASALKDDVNVSTPAPQGGVVGGYLPVETLESATTPINPQPMGIEPQGTKAVAKQRKKSRPKAQGQRISQRVDVRVGVNAGNKKYIKNTLVSRRN